MNCQPTRTDFIQLPATVTFSLCNGLLWMAHCLIIELPEPQLRDIRCTLDILSIRADQLLESAELYLSLDFNSLLIDPGKS